jgi:hypothetical protein
LRLHCWFEIYFNGYECDEDSETRDGRERNSYLGKKIEERRVTIVVNPVRNDGALALPFLLGIEALFYIIPAINSGGFLTG